MKSRIAIYVVFALVAGCVSATVIGQPAAKDDMRTCPADMVPVDTFCIDKYEYPNEPGVKVRNFVNFADAVGICLSQGKRLCTTDEWSRACSGPHHFQYPYGNEFREGACNVGIVKTDQYYTWYGLRKTDREVTASKPALTGKYQTCVSGYGAYDMVGNYWEWTDAGVTEHAILMGGSWATASDRVSCVTKTEKAIKFYRVPPVTFRCCSDFLPKSKAADVQKPPE
ncbi:MAG: SUMF1/EgtB/PvdO family nonheme iron enzyme [Candidatus Coatesbacteria bacterium]|nr:SUMF1/EgtB/PvdO family nonheme iron enzyme [Candidatus Coatesbacteria bacterium]